MVDLLEKIRKKTAKIAIVGLGYVGLPTALEFSKKGFFVIGLDVDKNKIEMINKGICPINDSSIIKDLKTEIAKKSFTVTIDYHEAVSNSDVIVLVVPTPVNDAKEPDLIYVKSSTESVSKHLKKGQLVILESTVYPGVTEDVVLPLLEKSCLKTPADFGIAYCPERFNPGDKTKTVDKVVRVIGAINKEWTEIADELYSNIQATFKTVDIKTAEAAKVIENTQRDLNIALMNEIALICEKLNIDIMNVLDAASTKWNFIKYLPGPGVGGHCLPHDPYYLVKIAKEKGYHAQVILSGRKVNDEMPLHVRDLIIKGLNYQQKPLNKSKLVILGAAYKKNIDDSRSSPSETLIESLQDYRPKITIIEPNIKDEIIFGCKNIRDFDVDTISSYDVLVFMVAHKEFSRITIDFLKQCIKKNPNQIIIDGARIFNGIDLKNLGYIYLGIGAGNINNSY